MPELISRPEVRWTTMARTSYGRLFKSTPHPDTTGAAVDAGGPAAIAEPKEATPAAADSGEGDESLLVSEEHWKEKLHFVFAPDLSSLVNPRKEDLVSRRLLAGPRPRSPSPCQGLAFLTRQVAHRKRAPTSTRCTTVPSRSRRYGQRSPRLGRRGAFLSRA